MRGTAPCPPPNGEIVRILPTYDPNLTFDENRAAGNVQSIQAGERLSAETQVRAGRSGAGGPAGSVPERTSFVNTNPNWGKPTNYQPVRSFRFSLRFTF